MAKAKLFLLNRQGVTDDLPVTLRFADNNKRNYIFLGFKCKPSEWDSGLCRFNSTYKKHRKDNKVLDVIEERAEEILNKYKKKGESLNFTIFKNEYLKQSAKTLTVFDYFDKEIMDLKKRDKIGNAGAYETACNSLREYHKSDSLTFQQIDEAYLKKFKEYLKSKKNKQGNNLADTTVSVYLRSLRAIYYRAMEEGLISQELNPFGKTKFSVNNGLKLKTRKRRITEEDIQKIKQYECAPKLNSWRYNAQQMFLFSYYAGGMNFVDMAYLRWKDVNKTEFIYRRRKTNKEYRIVLTQILKDVLNIYRGHNDKYIFPVLTNNHTTEDKRRLRIKTASKYMNKHLRKIAESEEVNIDINLTSYVARHSFASNLRDKGAPIHIIQAALGHEETQTTQVYLDDIDNKEVNKWMEKLD